jgi:hypothetical protein
MSESEIKSNKPDNIEVGMDTEVVETPSTDVAQEKPQQSIADEIQSRQNKIEQLTGLIETTNTDLQKEREKLGLPPITEEPPNVLADRKKIEQLKTEQEALEATQIKPQNEAEQKNETQKRVEKEFTIEIGRSLVRLSSEIEEFESTLKNNKFNPIPFHAEEFRTTVTDESVDLGMVTRAFTDLYTAMRKDFMPSDDEDKLSIEPYNFSRVIDSLDELRGVIIGLKKQINERPSEDEKINQELSSSITKVVNTIRTKMDNLEDSKTTLRRLKER